MTTLFIILGVLFSILIYIKIGMDLGEYFWVKKYSLEKFFDYYLDQPLYGIANITFNLFLWPIGVIFNLIVLKYWRPTDYI